MFDNLQKEWAPLDDVVFQLTPPAFHEQATAHYRSLGEPPVSGGSFWDVYGALLSCFRETPIDPTLEPAFGLANLGADDEMELVARLRDLRTIDDIIGEIAAAPVFEAEFSDSEDDSSNANLGSGDCEVEVLGDFTDTEEDSE